MDEERFEGLEAYSREELIEMMEEAAKNGDPKEAERIVDFLCHKGRGFKIELPTDRDLSESEIKSMVEEQMKGIVEKMSSDIAEAINMNPQPRLAYVAHNHKGSPCPGSFKIADAKHEGGTRPGFSEDSPDLYCEYPPCPDCHQIIDVEWSVGRASENVGDVRPAINMISSQEDNFHKIVDIMEESLVSECTDDDFEQALKYIECRGKFRLMEYDPPGMLEMGAVLLANNCGCNC